MPALYRYLLSAGTRRALILARQAAGRSGTNSRVTQAYPIRAIEPDEYTAFSAVPHDAFHSAWAPEIAQEVDRGTFEYDRSAAAFDGSQPVGTSATFTFRLSVPGGTVDAGGVSWVSVLPTYRRRGIMSAMIGHQLSDIAGRGEAVAALFASEAEIYGRFGFGCASEHLGFTIRRGEGKLIPPAAGSGPGLPRIREAGSTESLGGTAAAGALTRLYATVATSRPGMPQRDDRWWQARLADPEFARDGMTPMRCLIAEDDSGPRGYAMYAVRPRWNEDGLPAAVLSVRELLATDPQATAALWTELLTRDLVGEVHARNRPVDDALLRLLAGPRYARAALTDGLWVRLTDLPGALSQRRYACGLDIVLDVTDALLPDNAGRWRLQAAAGGPATCQRTTAAADVVAPVQALGAAYLGGTRLGSLAAAGQVTEVRPGALGALSAAMLWDPAPWCPMIF
jgi:predicted acetyltransferase